MGIVRMLIETLLQRPRKSDRPMTDCETAGMPNSSVRHVS